MKKTRIHFLRQAGILLTAAMLVLPGMYAYASEPETEDVEITDVFEEENYESGQETAEPVQEEALMAVSDENPDELLLGIFFNSAEDQSDTLYVSFDALEFRKIGYAFEDSDKTSSEVNYVTESPHLISNEPGHSTYYVNCLHDPSLQYHDGNYWSMSGFTMTSDGVRRFVPMLASSPDLLNWTHPNSGSQSNVVPKVAPYGKSGERDNADNFDSVAPDLLIEENGDAWIVVCLGYYSQFHGDVSANDKMSPYLIKVSGLKPGSTNPTTIEEKGKMPSVQYSDAIPINLPTEPSKNRIDGSLYKENGVYYLTIKENGVTNEIWSIDDLNRCEDPKAWKLVNGNVITGFEGPWLTKYMGTYYCFTDKLADYPPDEPNWKTGIHVTHCETLSGYWRAGREIVTKDIQGNVIPNRHGSVIAVTDADEIAHIMTLYRRQGWTYDPEKDRPNLNELDNCIWGHDAAGKTYWYEDGKQQGIYGDKKNIKDEKYGNRERGREIFDPESDGWYWLDAEYNGACALDKEVWMPYVYQQENTWDDETIRKEAAASDGKEIGANMAKQVEAAIRENEGKWVRYNYKGKMMKGWVGIFGELEKIYPDYAGNVYYYDQKTGLMAKGYTEVWDEEQGRFITHHFDEVTGVLIQD